MKYIAIYVRVSSNKQNTRSQEPDLKTWAEAYANGTPIKWYRDKATGKNMDRPGWKQLEADIRAGKVATLVVWRLDRLGRTASGLTALLEELTTRRINFVSLKDGIDLSTAAGRLVANVLASVAAYETEIRAERVAAGQAAGKRWGGRKSGERTKASPEKVRVILQMRAGGEKVAVIARTLGLSRPTVYSVLAENNGNCCSACNTGALSELDEET